MNACRHCKQGFEPRAWQVKTGDYECDPCRKERQANYRAARKAAGNPVLSGRMPREYHRAYASEYFKDEQNRERRNALMRKYREAHNTREHHKARWQVARAIASGQLTRMPCEICSAMPSEAHHDDYSKALEVRWLCRKHHVEHHTKATGEQA